MTQRRSFLAQLSLGTAALLAGSSRASAMTSAVPEPWLEGLKGRHKQFFDVGAHGQGNPLNRAMTFLNIYGSAYGLKDSDVNVIFGSHGTGLGIVLNDALWQHYNLGAHYGVDDPTTKAPAVRNPFSGVGSASIVDTSVGALQQRGMRFIGCMQSVARLSRQLAAKTGESQPAIADAIVAGFLPGVTPVPAMIVAASRAQESGLTYAYLG